MPLAHRPVLIVLLALLAVPGAGRAHDLMLTDGPDGLRVLVGHPAGAEHGAPTSDLPDSLLAAAWTLDDAGPLPINPLTQPLPCPAAARGAVAGPGPGGVQVDAHGTPLGVRAVARVLEQDAKPIPGLPLGHARAFLLARKREDRDQGDHRHDDDHLDQRKTRLAMAGARPPRRPDRSASHRSVPRSTVPDPHTGPGRGDQQPVVVGADSTGAAPRAAGDV